MGRNRGVERANLAQFVETHGGRAFTEVPVSGEEHGWPHDVPVHRVDAVWFDIGTTGEIVPWGDSLENEFADLVSEHAATLISPRGYADRTAFGMLISTRELFSRAYPKHQLLRAIALSEKMTRRSIAYLAEGIGVVRPDGKAPTPAGNRGPRIRRAPAELSAEDRLMVRYYEDALGGIGTLWQEVPVWDAALDGLRVAGDLGTLEWWPGAEPIDLVEVVANFDVEVIEAKRSMNTDVIGQTIAGAIVVAHQFPDHRLISQAVVVGGAPDPCLDWVCHKRGISVARYAE